MSIIMPAGDSGFNWSPKKGLNKTASTGEEQDDKTLLYEAAKKVLANQGCAYGGDDFLGTVEDVVEDAVEIADETGEDEGVVGDLTDDAPSEGGSVEEAVADAAEALDTAQEALEEVKESLGGDLGEGVTDEVEIEVEIDDEDEGSEVDEISSPKIDNADDGFLLETKEDSGEKCPACGHCDDDTDEDTSIGQFASSDDGDDDGEKKKKKKKKGGFCFTCQCKSSDCSCGDKKDDDDDDDDDDDKTKEASSNDWVKLSAVSPTNRKKLYDYWTKQLNYPKDFVKLMVKDYEK